MAQYSVAGQTEGSLFENLLGLMSPMGMAVGTATQAARQVPPFMLRRLEKFILNRKPNLDPQKLAYLVKQAQHGYGMYSQMLQNMMRGR